jgi:hypothetical protein
VIHTSMGRPAAGNAEADLLLLRADHADGAGPAGGPLLLLVRGAEERYARRALTRP